MIRYAESEAWRKDQGKESGTQYPLSKEYVEAVDLLRDWIGDPLQSIFRVYELEGVVRGNLSQQ